MPVFEVEFACLIPKTKPGEEPSEPFVTYKGTDYKKTLRLGVPSCNLVISRLKRFWNWLRFVWFHSRSRKCRKIVLVFILLVLLLLFTVCCVVLPLLFKYSPTFRQYVIFDPVVAYHASFDEPIMLHKSGDSKMFTKPNSFYVKVNSTSGAAVGAWKLEKYGMGSSHLYNRREYEDDLNNYLVFFHDGYGNRRSYTVDYSKFLHFFNIIVFDYRSFGDSYVADLNEKGLVHDGVQLLKWVQTNVNGTVFVWGDKLGSAIAAHAVARLKGSMCGLMLENPFTTMAEQLAYSWSIAMINWYTPWYKGLIGDALEDNDLSFDTNKYIKQISCPIGFFETNMHRASQFNIKLVPFEDGTFITSAVTRFQTYHYYKYDIYVSSEVQSLLRSFIRVGVQYCKNKKS